MKKQPPKRPIVPPKAEPKAPREPNPLPDVHFRITASEYRHLQAVARNMDRSVAYLITKIVREWLTHDDESTR